MFIKLARGKRYNKFTFVNHASWKISCGVPLLSCNVLVHVVPYFVAAVSYTPNMFITLATRWGQYYKTFYSCKLQICPLKAFPGLYSV
jgi:hypothetical protein